MRFFPLYIAIFLCLTACEETVYPILETDRQYTLFGTLDMAKDTQYVRVIPIRPTLVPTGEKLDATVLSRDLTGGQEVIWQDSTVIFDDGSPGKVFYVPLRIQPGHTYRIEVHPDGSDHVTSAETTVPEQPHATVMPEVLTYVLTSQVHARQSVFWEGIDATPYSIEYWYRFFQVSDFSFQDIQLPYAPLSGPVESQPGIWEVDLDLVRDRDSLDSRIDLVGGSISLAGLGMTITLLNEAFVPPGGAFDPEVLAQPGTLSNVENGFGFVGSVGRFSVEWLLADTTARALRYIPLNATPYQDVNDKRYSDMIR